MPTKSYNITFIPTAGSLGTLIKYKKSTDVSWTTPSSPVNPTTNNYYPLDLDEGYTYYVSVSAYGGSCTPKESIIEIVVAVDACCPATYTLSPDGSYCYKEDTTAATPPSGSPETTVAKSAVQYSTCGSYIYSVGFNVDGTGSSTIIPLTNSFWKNGGTCVDNNTSDGPLNRCGIWSTTTSDNQDVGFSICINLTEEKTYYIGVGCDNYGIIRVNGVDIVSQNATALDTQYGVGGAPFKVWHIYPVTLLAGPNVIEMLGHNDTGIAGFGAEIYDATPAQLIAATGLL